MIKYEDINDVDSLSSMLATRSTEHENFSIAFLDYHVMPNAENSNENLQTMGVELQTKHAELAKELDVDSIKKDFLNEIDKLFSENEIINIDLKDKEFSQARRSLISKLLLASNKIAINGRIGPGQYIIISERFYNTFKLSELDKLEDAEKEKKVYLEHMEEDPWGEENWF